MFLIFQEKLDEQYENQIVFVWLVGCVLLHINTCGLFNAKSCLYIS